MINTDAITPDISIADTPPPVVELRTMAPDDHRYACATWRECYKDSSAALLRAPWALYKQTVGKQIGELISAPSTRMVAAYVPTGEILGWISFTPGRSISTVHWVFTRYKLGDEKYRRRGIMTMLLEAAELGRRFAYTFRGPRRHAHHGGKGRGADAAKHSVYGPTLDIPISEWLRGRGVTAAYVSIEEWLK